VFQISQVILGTVDVIFNSTVITGHGTDFTLASAGDSFKINDESTSYQIGVIDSTTQITLSAAYVGVTANYQSYQICTDFTTVHEYPEINLGDLDWPDWYTKALRAIDGDIDRYGTSFDASPVTGQLMLRTDQGKLYFYNPYHGGAYWQSYSPETIYWSERGTATVGTSYGGALVAETRYIDTIYIGVGVAPSGSGITVDINVNNTSIFTAVTDQPVIAAASTFDTATPNATTAVGYGDLITWDIDGVGNSSPGGSNIYCTIVLV